MSLAIYCPNFIGENNRVFKKPRKSRKKGDVLEENMANGLEKQSARENMWAEPVSINGLDVLKLLAI